MKGLTHNVKLNCVDGSDEMTVSKSFNITAIDTLGSIGDQGFDVFELLKSEGVVEFVQTEGDGTEVYGIVSSNVVSGVGESIKKEIEELIGNGFLSENFNVDNYWDASVSSVEFKNSDAEVIEEFSNAIVEIFSSRDRKIII